MNPVSRGLVTLGGALLVLALHGPAAAQEIPLLTAPVNDFANVIDPQSAAQLETLIRSLERASGDIVVVATVQTFAPYADIRQYAVEMFENQGRGIGQKGRDNGLLVVAAIQDRRLHMEVGYDLEQFITDGFAGETHRQLIAPQFKQGEYGPGLVAGVARVIGRIADGRGVELQGVSPDRPQPRRRERSGGGSIVALILFFLLLNLAGRIGRGGGRRRRGWYSGVGPFGAGLWGLGSLGGHRRGGFRGGFGGGFGGGGGGFGGGFGGFGGGRSGGGGGGGSW